MACDKFLSYANNYEYECANIVSKQVKTTDDDG